MAPSLPHRPRPLAALRALVFDMDGTLIDSATVVPAAYVAAIRDLGGPDLTADDIIAKYSLGPPAVLLRHFLRREVGAREIEAYHARLRADVAAGVRPYAGIPALLAVASRRMPLAVFTGASRTAARLLLDAAGILPLLGEVVGGDEVERPKPAPDGIAEACRRLGVAAADAAYVGDAPLDMGAAEASGALAIGAAWGHQYDAAVRCDLAFRSPAELRRALVGAIAPNRGRGRRPRAGAQRA